MGKKEYKKYYFIALACLIAACTYPIYMGIYVIVETCANGFVRVEDYPKYVIPYTPIAIALIAGVGVIPLVQKLFKKFDMLVGAYFSVAVFFVAERLFETEVKVAEVGLESWQMSLCWVSPENFKTRTWEAVDILLGGYSPAFKIHFYLISVLLIIAMLNCFFGFGKMIREGDRRRLKVLIVQAAATAAFLGMCIWACFTSFYRTGELDVSPLSAALMIVFFMLMGIVAGVFGGSFLLGRKPFLSLMVPAMISAVITGMMYIGEMILLSGNLYRFGQGFFFEGMGALVLAPVDVLVIIGSGVATFFVSKALNLGTDNGDDINLGSDDSDDMNSGADENDEINPGTDDSNEMTNIKKNNPSGLITVVLLFVLLILSALASCLMGSAQSEPRTESDNKKTIDFEAAKSSQAYGEPIKYEVVDGKKVIVMDPIIYDTPFPGNRDLISANPPIFMHVKPEVLSSPENEAGIYGGYFFVPIDGEVYRYSMFSSLLGNHTKDALVYECTEDLLYEDDQNWEFYTVNDDPEHRYLIGTTSGEDSLLMYAPPLGVTEEDIEDAKAHGFVVMRGMESPYNSELMDEFLKKVEAHRSADVRIAKVHDASVNMAPDLELATKQDYPSLFLSEISFDGIRFKVYPINKIDGKYVLAERERIDSSRRTLKYLKRMTDIPRSENALYNSAERYVLVDDDTLTWDDLMSGVFSSRLGDYKPFEEIYTLYDVK